MPIKKSIRSKKRKIKANSGFAKLANITTKSLSNAYSNFKKNQEIKKIKEIKLKKLKKITKYKEKKRNSSLGKIN